MPFRPVPTLPLVSQSPTWPLLLQDHGVSADSISPASTESFSPVQPLLLREGRVFWAVSGGDGELVGSHAGSPFSLLSSLSLLTAPLVSSRQFRHSPLIGCWPVLRLSFKDQFSSVLGPAPGGLGWVFNPESRERGLHKNGLYPALCSSSLLPRSHTPDITSHFCFPVLTNTHQLFPPHQGLYFPAWAMLRPDPNYWPREMAGKLEFGSWRPVFVSSFTGMQTGPPAYLLPMAVFALLFYFKSYCWGYYRCPPFCTIILSTKQM